ncbi:centriolin [Microdochium nivale]|nr:centriolin [Microdochium nivale]
MSDRSDRSERKRVNFSDSPPAKSSSRSSIHSRDSAIGSSSSDQASSAGDRPDHRFTVADYNEQRSNVRALQEALDTANAEVEDLKKLLASRDEALKQAHKANREMEARRNALDNLSETIEQDKKDLKNQLAELKELNAAQKQQVDDFKDIIDELRDERADLQQQVENLVDPVRSPNISGAVKPPSSKALTRTSSRGKRDRPETRIERADHRTEHRRDRSEHRSEQRIEQRIERVERPSGSRPQKEERERDMKERMKDRLNRDSRPPLADSRRASTRRVSVSAGSNGRPYIEEPPTSPSSSGSVHAPHYVLTHPESARTSNGAYGATPRSRGSANSSGYTSPDRHETGAYVFHPLPDQRGGR